MFIACYQKTVFAFMDNFSFHNKSMQIDSFFSINNFHELETWPQFVKEKLKQGVAGITFSNLKWCFGCWAF